MIDMVQAGNRESLVEELRTAGAQISEAAAIGRSNFCCPYHGETNPSAHIKEGSDGRWRFKCFAGCPGGDALDLKARRENKDLKDVIRESDPQRSQQTQRRYSPRPSSESTQTEETYDQNEPQPIQPPAQPAQKPYRMHDTLETLKKAAVFSDGERLRQSHPDFSGRRVLAKTFPYTNPDTGRMELIVFRLEGPWDNGNGNPSKKSCLQGFENASGKFELRRAPGIAPIFNRKGIRNADTVVIVEGEGKVVALSTLGFKATCSPGGAQAAAKADWSPLSGKKLAIIWRDKDAVNKLGVRPGLNYQNDVIAELKKLPTPPLIKVVDVDAIRELPEDGSDVVDLVKKMGNLPLDQQKAYVQAILDQALPTGAAALLRTETQEVLEGTRNVIDWPWKMLADMTESIAAGTMTVICGDPGASKSLFLLQAFMSWHRDGIPVSLLELEDISVDKDTGVTSPVFHLRRAAAMVAGNSKLTSLRYQRENPDETRTAMSNDFLSSFGTCLHSFPRNTRPTVDNIVAWVHQEVKRGIRVVAIDPVTLADFGKDLHSEDSKFVRGIKDAIEGSNASIIAITHPRPGARRKTLDDFALTRDWGRHTQSAFWYDYCGGEKSGTVKKETLTGTMRLEESYNRIVHIKKARNTQGNSKKIAFMFDYKTLLVEEVGELVEK